MIQAISPDISTNVFAPGRDAHPDDMYSFCQHFADAQRVAYGDPLAFNEPDMLDNNRHAGRIRSCGMGIHLCLGSLLARLGGEIALETLAREVLHMKLATDAPTWRAESVLRGSQDLTIFPS